MNVLNWLLRKLRRVPKYIPVNRLESLLEDAARDPAKRPEFFRTLFHFRLFALGSMKEEKDGSKAVGFETSQWKGESFIYAYTSEEALRWQVAKEGQSKDFVALSASDLFGMLNGKLGIYLNSGHDFGKYFTAFEVKEVLAGIDLEKAQHTIKEGSTIALGQPKDRPHALIDSLSKYSKRTPFIKDLYFGQLAHEDGLLEYLGVIYFDGPVSQQKEDLVVKDLMMIVKEMPELGQPMSFTTNREDNSFQDAIERDSLRSVYSEMAEN